MVDVSTGIANYSAIRLPRPKSVLAIFWTPFVNDARSRRSWQNCARIKT